MIRDVLNFTEFPIMKSFDFDNGSCGESEVEAILRCKLASGSALLEVDTYHSCSATENPVNFENPVI